jgi:hypothetical protein
VLGDRRRLLLPALLTFLLLEDPGVKMLDRLHDKPPLIVFAVGDVLDFGKQFLELRRPRLLFLATVASRSFSFLRKRR